jgi:hypothetical protein
VACVFGWVVRGVGGVCVLVMVGGVGFGGLCVCACAYTLFSKPLH